MEAFFYLQMSHQGVVRFDGLSIWSKDGERTTTFQGNLHHLKPEFTLVNEIPHAGGDRLKCLDTHHQTEVKVAGPFVPQLLSEVGR